MSFTRHKLTFFNKTKMFFDVADTMGEAELIERVKKIADFKKFYVGRNLLVDGVAIRAASNDPTKFAAAVKKVAEIGLPMIFCSFNPMVLKAGLEAAKGQKSTALRCKQKITGKNCRTCP